MLKGLNNFNSRLQFLSRITMDTPHDMSMTTEIHLLY